MLRLELLHRVKPDRPVRPEADRVSTLVGQTGWKGAIRLFRDAEMKTVVLTDPQARDQAIRHFFGRAMRDVRGAVA